MELGTLYQLFGSAPVAFGLIMLWREIRAVRVELMGILNEQGRRVARLEDKVFPTGPGLNEPA